MKKFLITAVALTALTVTIPASAQNYNRVGVSYELETWNVKHGDNINLNGFGIDYIHGFGLSKNIPLYLETGLKMSMGFYSDSYRDYEEEEKVEENITKMSFSVPVNVAYKVNLGNNMSLLPYVGLNFKVNALANAKVTWKYDDYLDLESESETVNLLKGEDSANVFQLGWHLGVGFNYSKFYAGLSYGTDFIKFADGINSSSFNVTLGYNF